MLGDVVLCPSVAAKQGAIAGHSVQDELELLCTHGILHLLGFDHAEPDDEKEMFGLQRDLLTAWQSRTRAAQIGATADRGKHRRMTPGDVLLPDQRRRPDLCGWASALPPTPRCRASRGCTSTTTCATTAVAPLRCAG